MALQLGATRAALLEAGASPAAADKASEELATYDNQLSALQREMAVLRWMVGTNVALTLALVGKAFLGH